MAASVHVFARFIARPGKEDALKAVLTAAVSPTRRELGCYQYDLLVNASDAREFCFVERWENDRSLDDHLATAHTRQMLADVESLVESPPDIRRYRVA